MADDHIEKHNQKQVEAAEFQNRIYQDTMKALQTEDRFVNFLKPYHPASVEQFIKYYAQQKAGWYAHADSHHQFAMGKLHQWRYTATAELKEIYCKKLFDVICRWQAGEMDLEGIQVSADFEKWLNFPFEAYEVAPITQDEFDCYVSFMNSGETDEPDDSGRRADTRGAINFYHWYKCDGMTKEAEEMIPRWFHYYDSYFGTAPLRQLPIIRRALEEEYNDVWVLEIFHKTLPEEQLKSAVSSFRSRQMRLEMEADPEKMKTWIEKHNREYREEEKTRPKYVHMSTYNREKMDELVALIEPKEVRELYRASVEWRRRGQGETEILGTTIYLKEAKEYIPVESNDNYREALKNAYEIYKAKMTLQTLPLVFEEYCAAIKSGNRFSWKTSEYKTDSTFYSSAEWKKKLLAVRKLKGEPENLDFLKQENLPDKV